MWITNWALKSLKFLTIIIFNNVRVYDYFIFPSSAWC